MKQAKSFWAEFKQFISRGNVIDLAVGVIIGGAFTAIVNSLVNDVVMPVIGILLAASTSPASSTSSPRPPAIRPRRPFTTEISFRTW